MKFMTLSLALVALAFATPTLLVAADGAATTPMQMDCCNTTCPVCDKPVDKAIAPGAFKPTTTNANANATSSKMKHPEMEGANVGFCSMACKTEFEKAPEKFEEKLFPQWQQTKNKRVK